MILFNGKLVHKKKNEDSFEITSPNVKLQIDGIFSEFSNFSKLSEPLTELASPINTKKAIKGGKLNRSNPSPKLVNTKTENDDLLQLFSNCAEFDIKRKLKQVPDNDFKKSIKDSMQKPLTTSLKDLYLKSMKIQRDNRNISWRTPAQKPAKK